MNKEDIIRMAREAGFADSNGVVHAFYQLESFANLVRKDYSTTHANIWLDRIHKFMLAEREACAKVCEDLDAWSEDDPGSSAAKAIRARKETT